MSSYSGAFFAKNSGYQIKTPHGWKDFSGIECTSHDPIVRIEFSDGSHLECNHNHQLFKITDSSTVVSRVPELKIGDVVCGENSNVQITNIIDTDDVKPVYEVIEVQDIHSYYTNGVLSHNCEFITYQETLIDAMKMQEIKEMQVRKPLSVVDNIRWYKQPESGMTYVIALDPSSGTGGQNASKSNYSAIQCYEVPSLDQVCEWHANTVDIGGQVRMLNRILRMIDVELYEQGDSDPEIYWTVENNSIGEATIIDIMNMGLDNFPGTMLNEPRRTRTGKLRRGYNTSKTSKRTACLTLKKLVEQDKLEVASEHLLQELVGFIARDDNSTLFAAKDGSTDDLVSALLLVVRMVNVIANFEDDLAENIKETLDDELRTPLPMIISSNY